MALEASKNTDLIISAGGDGTLHEVVNGIMSSKRKPALTVFPIGTGNDFSRNFNIIANFSTLQKALIKPSYESLDIGEVQFPKRNTVKYFVNILDVGMGAEVVKKMNSGSRLFGPQLSYLWTITKTLITYHAQNISIKTDDGMETSAKTMSYVIANGAWFGNDIKIAPDALPNDGKLNFTHLKDFSFWEYLVNLPKAKSGKHITHSKVEYGNSNSYEVSGKGEMEADGEFVGALPMSVKCIPRALEFLLY